MKTSITFPGISVRIVTVILIGLLATPLLTAQGWYDTDWSYRNQVSVSYPVGVTGATLTGYQVKISLTGGIGGNFDFTKALSGGGDIRFTAADGITLIPFWIIPRQRFGSRFLQSRQPELLFTSITVIPHRRNLYLIRWRCHPRARSPGLPAILLCLQGQQEPACWRRI